MRTNLVHISPPATGAPRAGRMPGQPPIPQHMMSIISHLTHADRTSPSARSCASSHVSGGGASHTAQSGQSVPTEPISSTSYRYRRPQSQTPTRSLHRQGQDHPSRRAREISPQSEHAPRQQKAKYKQSGYSLLATYLRTTASPDGGDCASETVDTAKPAVRCTNRCNATTHTG